MAEVKWIARRVSDGVLVDVTGDTTGTPASAPTANALEAGSEPDFYAQPTDPGAVGAGSIWKDTAISPSGQWWTRNTGNNGWDGQVLIDVVPSSGAATASLQATSTGSNMARAQATALSASTGNASVQRDATSVNGLADVNAFAFASGSGNVEAIVNAEATTGSATAELEAIRGASVAGMRCEVNSTSARMGFFGVTPVAKAAANADTSGATLAQLETEVNELKAMLRAYGLLAT